MYLSPSLAVQVARARQAEILSDARHHRLIMEVRAPRRANRPRRAVARYLVLAARRMDPSLPAAAPRPAVERP